MEQQQHVPIMMESKMIEHPPASLAIEEPPTYDTVLNLGPISLKALHTLSVVKKYDSAYGIKPIEGSITDFKLGESIVNIEGNNLIIDGEHYKGTEGLWKLLILKDPEDYLKSDYDQYEKIMLQTKPFLIEDGEYKGRIKVSKGKKYNDIIKPIYEIFKNTPEYQSMQNEKKLQPKIPFQARSNSMKDLATRKSARVSPASSAPTSPSVSRKTGGMVYKYLSSDPDELVNRLQILIGESDAGNTNVFNEIHAIADELERQDII